MNCPCTCLGKSLARRHVEENWRLVHVDDKTLTTIDCSYLGFDKVNEVNCLSAQNVRRTLAFMLYLPEHTFICIAEAPHGKIFCSLLFLRKAALTSHAFRVNNCTVTMKPCSRSSKNHLNNCSFTRARTDCLPTCSEQRCAASGFDMSCLACCQRLTCEGLSIRSRQHDLNDSPASWRSSMMPRSMSFSLLLSTSCRGISAML